MKPTITVVLFGLLVIKKCMADYNSCKNGGGYMWHGVCFKIKVSPNIVDSLEKAMQQCRDDDGYLAALLGAELREAIGYQLTAKNEDYGWVAIVQKTGSDNPSSGWYYINTRTEENVDADGDLAVAWAGVEPNDGGGQEDNTENNGIIRMDGTIFDFDSNTFNWVKAAVCRYDNPGRHEYGHTMHGHRMTSHKIPLIGFPDVPTLRECVLMCHQLDFCRSISYSKVNKQCFHHAVSPTEPSASILADLDYDIYEALNVD